MIGGGNAGLCAALSAHEHGATVLVIERGPEATRGGNTRFTSGAFRVAYQSGADLREIIPDMTEEEERTIFGTPYTEQDFADDLARVTSYRANPELVSNLATRSRSTLAWVRSQGVRFIPLMAGWHDLSIQAVGGGVGLVEAQFNAALARGIDVWYDARAIALRHDRREVGGVDVLHRGERKTINARTVVLAAGGFQANAAWRAKYLGPGWDLAKVRGTWCNTGDGIAMALGVGAQPYGHWSGAHAVAWDLNAPDFGDLRIGAQFQKHSYPLGIMVNAHGERFVDEGADFRDYTYALYGARILDQPAQVAWQLFDAKTTPLLRDEYRIRTVSKCSANSISALGSRMDGLDSDRLVATVDAYNRSIDDNAHLDYSKHDGRRADLRLPKSNWAQRLDTPPFESYAVTCGVTFTFGGVKIDTESRVLGYNDAPLKGLYAAGEMAGGTFYFNYPGGTGLIKGAVEGRTAGASAARYR